MKRVTIIPSHEMTLFGPRITIFTKDGKSYTKQGTGREFIWDFDEEARRIRERRSRACRFRRRSSRRSSRPAATSTSRRARTSSCSSR